MLLFPRSAKIPATGETNTTGIIEIAKILANTLADPVNLTI